MKLDHVLILGKYRHGIDLKFWEKFKKDVESHGMKFVFGGLILGLMGQDVTILLRGTPDDYCKLVDDVDNTLFAIMSDWRTLFVSQAP
jgi:hypothetical protein